MKFKIVAKIVCKDKDGNVKWAKTTETPIEDKKNDSKRRA
jgi:hypothetical protein